MRSNTDDACIGSCSDSVFTAVRVNDRRSSPMPLSVGPLRAGPLVPLVLLGIILVLAGCGPASSGGSTAHTGSGTGSVPTYPHDDISGNDLAHEWVVAWSRYEPVSADRLRFFYTGGDPACYGVRVAVQETGTTIEVATLVGTKPGAPAECTLVASLSSVILTTAKPIGTRTVTHLEDPLLHP